MCAVACLPSLTCLTCCCLHPAFYPTGEKLAIKKITNAFENLVDARRTLREMKLLRYLR